MKIYVTDIEGNNLYQHITKFHCAWVIDVVTGNRWGYRPEQLSEYCDKLAEADVVVGHNIVDFDCPALKKLNGKLTTKAVFDTLVISRMLEPDRIQGHSLDSWGKSLGCHKGDFGKQENAWEVFTEEMYEYCEQDVAVTLKLYKHLCEQAGFDPHNPPCINFNWSEY
ncbi:MAG: hypothetical protein ACRC6V_19620 [Bacteroidales bacterium]